VNTVNTQGVMGKGVTLEFKRLFPEIFEEYRRLCEQDVLEIGKLHLYKTPHKWVLNFPTKTDWRKPSRLEYIEAGLKRLASAYTEAGIRSLAMPPIGCGNGQLDWRTQVGPLVHKFLDDVPIAVYVYPARTTAAIPAAFSALVGAARLSARAFALAHELDHPVYDCLYLALAEIEDVRMVTADRRLLERLRGSAWQELARPLVPA
jgi:hypothetical protein